MKSGKKTPNGLAKDKTAQQQRLPFAPQVSPRPLYPLKSP